MICQKCNKNIATVHYTEIINGNATNLYLCEDCANLKGKFNKDIGLDEILAGLMGFDQAKIHQNKYHIVCPKCGLTYDEFKKIGKFGCEKCYEVFQGKIEPILKQLHGSVQYKGDTPKEKNVLSKEDLQLRKLREELNEKVKSEEYEEAAKLRDMIKEIENRKRGE